MYTSIIISALIASSSLVKAAPIRIQRRQALDFGSCSNPAIEFAAGLDGRNEDSFEAVNQADFNHGSALNIGVIANFICGQLQSSCKASAATVSACDSATTAAEALTGQAAADAFNSALGVSSGSAAAVAATPATAAVSAAAPPCVEVTLSAATPVASTSAAAVAAATPAAAIASGANLQTFTGALGGLPPPVTAGGKGFIVNGSEFIQEAGALGRSCDEQHNTCANAANAGGAAFSTADCETQNTACHAIASAA